MMNDMDHLSLGLPSPHLGQFWAEDPAGPQPGQVWADGGPISPTSNSYGGVGGHTQAQQYQQYYNHQQQRQQNLHPNVKQENVHSTSNRIHQQNIGGVVDDDDDDDLHVKESKSSEEQRVRIREWWKRAKQRVYPMMKQENLVSKTSSCKYKAVDARILLRVSSKDELRFAYTVDGLVKVLDEKEIPGMSGKNFVVDPFGRNDFTELIGMDFANHGDTNVSPGAVGGGRLNHDLNSPSASSPGHHEPQDPFDLSSSSSSFLSSQIRGDEEGDLLQSMAHVNDSLDLELNNPAQLEQWLDENETIKGTKRRGDHILYFEDDVFDDRNSDKQPLKQLRSNMIEPVMVLLLQSMYSGDSAAQQALDDVIDPLPPGSGSTRAFGKKDDEVQQSNNENDQQFKRNDGNHRLTSNGSVNRSSNGVGGDSGNDDDDNNKKVKLPSGMYFLI